MTMTFEPGGNHCHSVYLADENRTFAASYAREHICPGRARYSAGLRDDPLKLMGLDSPVLDDMTAPG
jgi:hypothetical protein